VRRLLVAGGLLLVLAGPTACSKTDAPDVAVEQNDQNDQNDAGGEDVAPTKKIFKEDDTTIKVAVGEKFGIRVKENASIGDAWKLVSQPDDRILEDEGNSYKADQAEPMPGSGGQREFKFKARAAGTTTVTLFDCYRCAGNGQVSPENSAYAKRITFTITVG